MSDLGLLLSAPMARAVARGIKTQTRRLPTEKLCWLEKWHKPKTVWPTFELDQAEVGLDKNVLVAPRRTKPGGELDQMIAIYPRCGPNDAVWFRETWSPDGAASVYPFPGTWYRADFMEHEDPALNIASAKTRYNGHDKGGWRAEDVCPMHHLKPQRSDCLSCHAAEDGFRWRSALHMPRHRCRLFSTVTDVRFERLQSISDEDCIREGMVKNGAYWDGAPHAIKGTPRALPTAREAYEDLWEHLNGPGSWAKNPWVLVIGFKKRW